MMPPTHPLSPPALNCDIKECFHVWLKNIWEHNQAPCSTKLRSRATWQDSSRAIPPWVVVIHGEPSEQKAMLQIPCIPLIPWLLQSKYSNMQAFDALFGEGTELNWKGTEKLGSYNLQIFVQGSYRIEDTTCLPQCGDLMQSIKSALVLETILVLTEGTRRPQKGTDHTSLAMTLESWLQSNRWCIGHPFMQS